MKWVLFAIALAAIIPLSDWLRRNPSETPKVWVLFGAMPYVINPHISPVDWTLWPGYVTGIQITGLDLLALTILFSLPRFRYSIPFRLVMGFYFVAVVLSIFQAKFPMPAVFYAWQLARLFLVYVVVLRACADERVPTAILTGMAIGLCWQAVFAIWQRYGAGILQTGGTFGDKNALGLASEFAIFPIFAVALARKGQWQMIAAALAGVIVTILTISRAAVGLGVVGIVSIFALSSMHRWTARKILFLLIGIIVIGSLAPVTLSSFEKRFASEPTDTEFNERDAFEKAASLMLVDHPFGVGANNYTIMAITGYAAKADIPWGGGQRAAIVHNIYWLTAAETGYLGALALGLLLINITVTTFRCYWKNKRVPQADLLLGLGVSLLIVEIHSAFEWVLFLFDVQYLFAITTGLAAGLAVQLGYWRPEKSRDIEFTPQFHSPPKAG